jgi:hypothetical protein
MATLKIPLVAYGQKVSGITFPVGSTVNIVIACQDPDTRLPIDLTGANLKFSVAEIDLQGNPILPANIVKMGTILAPPSAGNVIIPIIVSDTIPSGVPMKPKVYAFDLWLTDADGNRIQSIVYGLIDLTPTIDLPGTPVTPSPSQVPLALGPKGDKGDAGLISFRRTIDQPADSNDFFILLPSTLGDDTYRVTGSVENASGMFLLNFPNSAPTDRTTTQFRCVTSAPMDDGDTLNLFVGAEGIPDAGGLPDIIAFNVLNPSVLSGSVVRLSAANTVDLASATSVATAPAIGVVSQDPSGGFALVVLEGEVDGFVGLIPGATYYMNTVAGGIIGSVIGFVAGNVVQKIGYAKNPTTLIVEIDLDYTVL